MSEWWISRRAPAHLAPNLLSQMIIRQPIFTANLTGFRVPWSTHLPLRMPVRVFPEGLTEGGEPTLGVLASHGWGPGLNKEEGKGKKNPEQQPSPRFFLHHVRPFVRVVRKVTIRAPCII